MSGTNQTFPIWPPSDPNGKAEKDGYRASFYPGFVGRLAVRSADGSEIELYKQSGRFFLPPGVTKPWPLSTLEFTRPDGSRIALQVDDPNQQIERIEIHLKGKGGSAYAPAGEDLELAPSGDPPPPPPGEVLVCEDGVVLCPPVCPGEDGE